MNISSNNLRGFSQYSLLNPRRVHSPMLASQQTNDERSESRADTPQLAAGSFIVLLSTETGSQDKCQILEEDFHIRMTQTLESEVSLMCNLSKGVEEKGIEKGRQEGIIAMVSALKDLQIADSIILNKIQEKFHLAEETAKMYLQGTVGK